jgi:hypothetical protein
MSKPNIVAVSEIEVTRNRLSEVWATAEAISQILEQWLGSLRRCPSCGKESRSIPPISLLPKTT